MNNAIFLPEKMRVGFQNRDGTYTGRLAYVTYYDNKGKLRKERSWEGWRDSSIEPMDFLNEPTEGFVLNKKAGGYDTGWNHRNTYCRVYDPRCGGIEFEINIENLLYILENTNSIKGKGLEGKFVYGMDGKDLILIPCDSPDYKQLKEFNDKLRAGIKFNMKNMIKGATYLNSKNKELVYIGRYEFHDSYSRAKKTPKKYYFYDRKMKSWRNDNLGGFVTYSSVGQSIIQCIDETCCSDYADLFDKFEYYEHYNPYDSSKDEYINHTLQSFEKWTLAELEREKNKRYNPHNFVDVYYYTNNGEEDLPHSTFSDQRPKVNQYARYHEGKGFRFITREQEEYKPYSWSYATTRTKCNEEYITIEEFFNRTKPQYKREYLTDGKLRKEYYND